METRDSFNVDVPQDAQKEEEQKSNISPFCNFSNIQPGHGEERHPMQRERRRMLREMGSDRKAQKTIDIQSI